MEIIKTVKFCYKDRFIFWLTNISILIILASGSLLLFNTPERSPLAVIHLNIYDGIDVVGSWRWLIIFPVIALGLSLINFMAAVWLWAKQRVLSYWLITSILLVNLIVFLYLFNILNYN